MPDLRIPDDELEVRRAVNRYSSAAASGDVAAASRVFSADARAWVWAGGAYRSSPIVDFIRATFESSCDGYRGETYSYEIIDATLTSRLAVVVFAEYGQAGRHRTSVFNAVKGPDGWDVVAMLSDSMG